MSPLRIAVVLALLWGATSEAAGGGAAAVAQSIDGEDAQCRFMLFLCREASRALEQLRVMPSTNETEVIATRATHEAELRTRDAVEAARVIVGKHGGKKPSCFQRPECEFLDQALDAR